MEPVSTTATALNRLLDPLTQSLSVEAAQQLLGFRIDPAIQARIDELADRCNEGLLTEAERAEYESYVEGVGLINLLQAKARRMDGDDDSDCGKNSPSRSSPCQFPG